MVYSMIPDIIYTHISILSNIYVILRLEDQGVTLEDDLIQKKTMH